jgi:hypothetical protein
VQYTEDYAAAGVPLSYVGPENETTIAPPQDSMIMSAAQTARPDCYAPLAMSA